MTDMFVLLQLPNAGDDLQAIKKGVMELADLVVINKADLDEAAATRAQAQITSALRVARPARSTAMRPPRRRCRHRVLQLSALKGTGIELSGRGERLPRPQTAPAAPRPSAGAAGIRPGCGSASTPAAAALPRPPGRARGAAAGADDVAPAALAASAAARACSTCSMD
jgi:LAO/AO transport system kinase